MKWIVAIIQLLLLEVHSFSTAANNKQLKISFVTGNEMKAKEMRRILGDHGALTDEECTNWYAEDGGGDDSSSCCLFNLQTLNVDLPEIQEVDTLAIAKNKAIQGAFLSGGPCVVEDTSLQFTALGGMPGPYIKWFSQKLGNEGLYNILQAYEDKSATAVCTLAFCSYPHADPVLFTGETKGKIVKPTSTVKGGGWDAIFVPDTQDKSFSEMNITEKNRVSHRGKAVRKWADWLATNQDELWERQNGSVRVGHQRLSFKTATGNYKP